MAIRDMFRNYFYGKPGQRDFTLEDLPANRIELFKQVLNVRKGSMIGLNLLYLAIWVPAILWTFLNVLQLLVAETPTNEFVQQVVFSWLLLMFPLTAITGPFNAGASYVFHHWARDEHSFPYADFKSALKENWKQALIFSTLDGLVPLLFYLCARFYLGMAEQSMLFLLPLALTVIAALLWFIAAPLVPNLIVSYRQSIGGILRNALLMTMAQLPRAVAVRLATLAVPILAFACFALFPNTAQWISSIVSLLYIVILLSFNKLIWASFANYLGEKYLNTKIEGARTDIGLRPKDGGA